ncbi:RNA polymerase sigma-70 factor [Chitinophaga sp. SYP-B3965]|uniref:RNA polymerase sigma-70 factor n=1 Tax=Chitinophaga sp. SYP-B3965 TaxID=2663120 RepID=UPI001299EA89|nr:RNA polymerase sigma-70 factor [Chitinophaga sp. SYP-B3965]MRG45232.1 RNA polymerase sigma-70 factor [Chitinophaga sp. SYP-B3965]
MGSVNLQFHSDEDLLLLLQRGGHHAFREIYKRYWDKLLYIAGKKLDDLSEAESIVQDVFVDLWQRREILEIKQQLAGYLVVAVRYRMLNFLARQQRAKTYIQETARNQEPGENSTEELLGFEELRGWLEKMVSRLPEKCQLAYRLRGEGYSQREIAGYMKVSEKTVETHISRALKILRTGLGQLISRMWMFFF